jgi:hypothetical protein
MKTKVEPTIIYPENLNKNVAIISWPRCGTNKLGAWFNENGFLFLDEPFSLLRNNYIKKSVDPFSSTTTEVWRPNYSLDNWLLKLVATSPAPACIKVQLREIYDSLTRSCEADRLLLGTCFPLSVYLYRKSSLDVAASYFLARKKNVFTNDQNKVNSKTYNEKITITIDEFDKELTGLYNSWRNIIMLPIYKSEKEIWITHEDDLPSLEVKTHKRMPEKKNIIENWQELETYYNDTWILKFNDLTDDIMDKREQTKDDWIAYKQVVLEHSKKYHNS